MGEPLRVAHVVLSLDCGGLERIVLHLLHEGQVLGQQVAVLCLERPGALAAEATALGASLLCADKPSGLRLGTVCRVRSLLQQFRPDVVHTHQIGALFYTGPAAQACRVPLTVHTEHGKYYSSRGRNRWLGWLAGHFATRFFCVTQDVAREARAYRVVSDRKLSVVSNGIDTMGFRARGSANHVRALLDIPPGAPVIGTVGRLAEIKRQDLLLRAFAAVRHRVPDAHLLLVGDGPLREDLQRLAGQLELGESAHFVGYQPEPAKFLAAMDVFALTSRSEGMPLVVLEAWAAGLPVVASAVGGLPELIDHGTNGLLFPADNEPRLACLLSDLLHDRASARRLGEAGQREVEARFTMRRMAEVYDRHYRELLGDGRTVSRPPV